jgi:20S proteasome subunit alpha 5
MFGFTVSLLIAGADAQGPHLFHTDPSGAYSRYYAKAIGSGSESAQATLQEQYNKSMSLPEAKKLTLSVLKQVMEDKLSVSNIEVAVVENGQFRMMNKAELEALIASLDQAPLM